VTIKHPRLPTRPPSPRRLDRVATRRRRRLSDKVRVAFHTACDEGAVEIAGHLLEQLDQLVHRPPVLPTGIDRRRPESLAAVSERLANLLLWRTETAWNGRGSTA
jgi:hypothetical protein